MIQRRYYWSVETVSQVASHNQKIVAVPSAGTVPPSRSPANAPIPIHQSNVSEKCGDKPQPPTGTSATARYRMSRCRPASGESLLSSLKLNGPLAGAACSPPRVGRRTAAGVNRRQWNRWVPEHYPPCKIPVVGVIQRHQLRRAAAIATVDSVRRSSVALSSSGTHIRSDSRTCAWRNYYSRVSGGRGGESAGGRSEAAVKFNGPVVAPAGTVAAG